MSYRLPARLAFKADSTSRFSKYVIKGTPGSHGDAGWMFVDCTDKEHALAVMRDYPQARMPCWKRIEGDAP